MSKKKQSVLSRKGALSSAMLLAQEAFHTVEASHITVACITDSPLSGALSSAQIAGDPDHLSLTLAALMTRTPKLRQIITRAMDIYIQILSDPDSHATDIRTIEETHDPQ